MIMASPQNTLKLTQTNPYTTQNQNLDRVFRGAHCLNKGGKSAAALFPFPFGLKGKPASV
jgi:hypothetical protein